MLQNNQNLRFGEKVEKADANFLGIVQTKNRPPHYVLQVS